MKPRRENLAGAIVGAAAGEALGMPLKFASRKSEAPIAKYFPGSEFGGVCGNLKAGQWTDGVQELTIVLESLLNRGKIDTRDLRKRLHDWARSGKCRIPGGTLQPAALSQKPARSEDSSPLVLAAPLAFLISEDDAAAVCRLTHESKICSEWMSGIYKAALGGRPEAEKFFKEHSAQWEGGNTAWAVDTGMSALKAVLEADNFKDAVTLAANYGGNADGIAVVAGGIAGAWHTFSGIPEEFLFTLEDGGKLRRLADMLYERFSERFAD